MKKGMTGIEIIVAIIVIVLLVNLVKGTVNAFKWGLPWNRYDRVVLVVYDHNKNEVANKSFRIPRTDEITVSVKEMDGIWFIEKPK